MVIRVGGGRKGIAAYLKTGKKQGRKESREELDERVVLAGDLEVLDKTVAQLGAKSENYLHITLSFGEGMVTVETLRSIVDEFRRFLFVAYRDDEAWLYAEAHLPRVQSLEKAVGGTVVRLPHIHVIVPKLNLLTGKWLNPLGKVARQIPFLDAFQESVNARYGLTSPKDYRRVLGQGKAEVLSRSKGDQFEGQHRDLKLGVLETILSKDLRSLKDLHSALSGKGEVRVRNSDTAHPYLNIKPFGQPKGINLKEFPFSPEFLAWPLVRKRVFLDRGAMETSQEPKEPRPVAEDHERLLNQWLTIRAREVKYMNSGNRKLWQDYQDATIEGKNQILDRQANEFYRKVSSTAVRKQAQMEPASPKVESEPSIDPATGMLWTHQDSALGQLVVDEVHRALDEVLCSRLPLSKQQAPSISAMDELETEARLTNKQREEGGRIVSQEGCPGLYRWMRSRLHWSPYACWVFLKRQEMVRAPESWALPQREASEALRLAYRRRLTDLESQEVARIEQDRRLSVLHMSYILSRMYLWAKTQKASSLIHSEPEMEFNGFVSLERPSVPQVPNGSSIPQWSWKADDKGQVDYGRRGTAVLKDTPDRVVVLEIDDEVVQVALRLAYAKWGLRFEIRGSEQFKRTVAAQAIRMKLKFEFLNPEMGQYLNEARHKFRGRERE